MNRFATKKGEKYIVGTRLNSDVQNGIRFFTDSVADVGYIKNYYDTHQQEDVKFWEHYLNDNFDGLCGQPLGNIISAITLSSPGTRVLSEKRKAILSRIIMSQAIRVPEFLEEQNDDSIATINACKKQFLESIPCIDEKIVKLVENISFDENARKDIILKEMFKNERFLRFCRILERKAWVVYYNGIRTRTPFMTSDNPVVFSDINGKEIGMTKVGIINDRTVILYPISPSILIGIYSPNIFGGKFKEYDGRIFKVNDERFIKMVNLGVLSQSKNHTFLPEPLFSFFSKAK